MSTIAIVLAAFLILIFSGLRNRKNEIEKVVKEIRLFIEDWDLPAFYDGQVTVTRPSRRTVVLELVGRRRENDFFEILLTVSLEIELKVFREGTVKSIYPERAQTLFGLGVLVAQHLAMIAKASSKNLLVSPPA